MAAGELNVIVRAVTAPAVRDIQQGFNRMPTAPARALGARWGTALGAGFNEKVNASLFTKFSKAIQENDNRAVAASRAWATLNRAGIVLGQVVNTLIGGIAGVVASIGSIGGSAIGAAASVAVLGNAFFALGSAMVAARLALGGVGKALSAYLKQGAGGGGGGAASNGAAEAAAARAVEQAEQQLALTIERNRESLLDANNAVRASQLALNEALKAGREEIQQLGFEAEDAALAEQRAALDLEKARLQLAGVQDLPPNSRVRREAELAYQEAELNYRKAKDSAADLAVEQDRLSRAGVRGTDAYRDASDALAKAIQSRDRTVRDASRSEAEALAAVAAARDNAANAGQGASGGGGGADWAEGLNEYQKAFVEFLANLQPRFKELKRLVSEAFLPPLQEAITILMDSGPFDVFQTGMVKVAGSLGQATISIAKAIAQASNLSLLGNVFASSATIIETMGRSLGSLWGVMLSVLNAVAPQAERFFSFLEDRLATLDAYWKTFEGANELADFFKRSADQAARWGDVLGNIFGGISGLVNDALTPGSGGDMMLQWLQDITQAWNDMNNTVEGRAGIREYLQNASAISIQFLGLLGGIATALASVTQVMNEAGEPVLAVAFEKLKEALPALTSIVQTAATATPIFAAIVVELVKIFDLLLDSATLEAFGNTILFVVEKIREFLELPFVQRILEFLAPISGVLLALGGMFTLFSLGISVISGFIARIAATAGSLAGLLSPVGLVIAAIVALIAGFVYFYETNAEFAASIDGMISELQAAFLPVLEAVMGAVSQLIPVFLQLIETVGPLFADMLLVVARAITDILTAIAPLIGVLIGALVPIISVAVEIFGSLLKSIMPLISTIIAKLVPVITMVIGAVTQLLSAIAPLVAIFLEELMPVIDALLPVLTLLITSALEVLVQVFNELFTAFMPVITMLVSALVPALGSLIQAIMPVITALLDLLIPVISQLLEAFLPIVSMLADLLIPVIGFLVEVLSFVIDILLAVVEVIVGAVSAALVWLIEGITFLATNWDEIWTRVGETFRIIWDTILTFLVDTWNNIVGTISLGLQTIFDFWVSIWTNIFNFFSTIWTNIINFVTDVVTNIYNTIRNVMNNVKSFWDGLWNGFSSVVSSVWDGIVGFVKGGVNGVISAIEGMINGVIDGINGMIRGLNTVIGAVGGAIGLELSVGSVPKVNLPRLAKGGTVFPSAGGSIVNVAEAGRPERIEPLDPDGLSQRDHAIFDKLLTSIGSGGDTNFYITQQPNEDGQEFAERVARILAFNQRKGGASYA